MLGLEVINVGKNTIYRPSRYSFSFCSDEYWRRVNAVISNPLCRHPVETDIVSRESKLRSEELELELTSESWRFRASAIGVSARSFIYLTVAES